MTPTVSVVPCLADNFAYVVVAGSRVAVVDPGDAAPVELALRERGLPLHEIWCTHHHLDHVAGVTELLRRHPGATVRGSAYDADHRRIEGQTVAHRDADRFDFGGAEVVVHAIPGHTLGAIAFTCEGALFSGDTLFLGGCGRVFEGTMAMMAESMRKLRRLPPETRVYCGHEYTVANLRFAKHVDPENPAVDAALVEAEATLAAGRPTVPGTLGRELEVNPFLRFDVPALAEGRTPDESFAALREAKNVYRA